MFSAVSILLGIGVMISPFGTYIEREWGLQWLFTLRGPIEPPAEVAVVGINSQTGNDMGLPRLPRYWPRSLYGVAVDRLRASGVETIVFDMDFSQEKVPLEDQLFADAIGRHSQVVLFERLEGRNQRVVSGSGVERWLWVETAQPPAEVLREQARAVAPFPLPKIDKSSFQFWAFKPSADDTPTTASVAVQLALLAHHQAWRRILEKVGIASSQVPPATALSGPRDLREYMRNMRKLFLGNPFLKTAVQDQIPDSVLSEEERQAIRVLASLYGGPDERYTNLYGPPGTISTVSFQKLKAVEDLDLASLPDDITPNATTAGLGGKTIFVGYSDLFSPDQPDRFHTVFTSDRGIDLSGCEIMATAFANLLTDSTIRPAPQTLSLIFLAVFGLVICQLIFWPSGYIAVPLVLATGIAYAYGASEVFERHLLWIPLAIPLSIQLPFVIVAGLLGQYLVERRQKQRVGAAISAYLPQHLVKDLTEGNLDEASLNQVVHGVCLANDMSGFSSIAERMTPDQLAGFMNDYFETIAATLKECEVDVTEFHADTIMCAFIGDPDDKAVRRRAVQAALAVVDAIEAFSRERSDAQLSARVGLQDGHFYLGHTGGGGRMSYSILGNPANSAARLEGLNKTLGTKILAAETVVGDLQGVASRALGNFRVVGKNETVAVVEVVCDSERLPSEKADLLKGFASGLQAFSDENWEGAAKDFEELVSHYPFDQPSQFYLDVCRSYIANGPPDEEPTRLAMTSK